MEVFGLGVRIQEEGAATVEASLARLTKQFAATYLGVTALTNGLRKLVQTGDTMLLLEGRIGLVTDRTQNLREVQDKLFESAQRTRSSYEGTAELFARVARNSDQLGYSQQQLLNFTELTQMSIRTSGINAIEASRGMIQLSQAMASGVLRGDEFRAVMEQMPGLSAAMASGLGVTIGQLREMANSGELTAQKVMEAILKMEASIRRDFEKLPVTVGDGMTRIGNSLAKAIEKINQSTDASQTLGRALSNLADFITANLADAVIGLAENVNTLKAAFIGLGGVLAAFALPSIIGGLTALGAAVSSTAVFFGVAFGQAFVLKGIFASLGPLIVGLSAKFTALWTAIAGPLGVAVVGIVGLFAYLNKQLDDTQKIYDDLDAREDANMRRTIERIRKEKAERDEQQRQRSELTKKQIEDLQKQIAQTIQYNSLLPIRERNVNDLLRVEKILSAELENSNTTLERRIEVFQQLRETQQMLYDLGVEFQRSTKTIEMFGRALSGVTVTKVTGFQDFMNNVRQALRGLEAPQAKPIPIGFSLEASMARLNQDFRAYSDAVIAEAQRLKTSVSDVLMKDVGVAIGMALENGIAAGLQAALMSGKISDLWKAMAQTFVAEIANMMVRVAMTYIKMAAFIQKIQATLISNPALAIAAAVAMLAFCYANGGKASVGGTTVAGGAGGLSVGMTPQPTINPIIFGQTSATTAAGMTPRQATNITIIGPNDPSAQRAIQELMNKANSRGRIG